jgi:hypothetical protein
MHPGNYSTTSLGKAAARQQSIIRRQENTGERARPPPPAVPPDDAPFHAPFSSAFPCRLPPPPVPGNHHIARDATRHGTALSPPHEEAKLPEPAGACVRGVSHARRLMGAPVANRNGNNGNQLIDRRMGRLAGCGLARLDAAAESPWLGRVLRNSERCRIAGIWHLLVLLLASRALLCSAPPLLLLVACSSSSAPPL